MNLEDGDYLEQQQCWEVVMTEGAGTNIPLSSDYKVDINLSRIAKSSATTGIPTPLPFREPNGEGHEAKVLTGTLTVKGKEETAKATSASASSKVQVALQENGKVSLATEQQVAKLESQKNIKLESPETAMGDRQVTELETPQLAVNFSEVVSGAPQLAVVNPEVAESSDDEDFFAGLVDAAEKKAEQPEPDAVHMQDIRPKTGAVSSETNVSIATEYGVRDGTVDDVNKLAQDFITARVDLRFVSYDTHVKKIDSIEELKENHITIMQGSPHKGFLFNIKTGEAHIGRDLHAAHGRHIHAALQHALLKNNLESPKINFVTYSTQLWQHLTNALTSAMKQVRAEKEKTEIKDAFRKEAKPVKQAPPHLHKKRVQEGERQNTISTKESLAKKQDKFLEAQIEASHLQDERKRRNEAILEEKSEEVKIKANLNDEAKFFTKLDEDKNLPPPPAPAA